MVPFIIDIHGFSASDQATTDAITAATKAFLDTLKDAGVKFFAPPANPEAPTEEEKFSMATIRHAYAQTKLVKKRYISASGNTPGMEQDHFTVEDAQVTEDLLAEKTRGTYEHMRGL